MIVRDGLVGQKRLRDNYSGFTNHYLCMALNILVSATAVPI